MFSVLFEVLPAEGKKDEYLELVQHLKPILETIDGYIESERFENLSRPGWILSLQAWRDEKSVVRWRTEGQHHAIQVQGRFQTFRDYHVRGGETTFDTDPPPQAPIRDLLPDETDAGPANFVTFTDITPPQDTVATTDANLLCSHLGLDPEDNDIVDLDVYSSIYCAGKIALVVGWKNAEAGNR